MNTLLAEIVRSLKELQLGFAGELTMSDAMEGLMDALYLDKVTGLSLYVVERRDGVVAFLGRTGHSACQPFPMFVGLSTYEYYTSL